MEGFELVERAPTVAEYQRLRTAVGWSPMSDEAVAAGLPRSLYSVVLEHDGEVVGCGRVVGDGGLYFYVQDMIVLSEFRGRGLGARIMAAVMSYLQRSAWPGTFVGLMAAEGAEGFYLPYGFRRRPDDRPGMYRVWK